MDEISLFPTGTNIYSRKKSFVGSLRATSSSLWRDKSIDVFSKSVKDEDDEEALKWASLEKLPTFDRLKKGLLLGSQGVGFSEVDIDDLGYDDRRKLIDRLVKVAEEDNEKFLLKLKNRIDAVGIDLPTIEVRFEHLNIEAQVHVGSRALPSFVNFNIGIIEGLLNNLKILPSSKKKLNILQDVNGVLKPGRMTLLLGPPSSGKTTLLLALAGKLDSSLKVSGRVTYNGHGMNEFVPQRTAAYISQHDLHIGEMTVKETLAFSARCQGVGSRYEMLMELSRREKEANIKPDPDIDIFMKAAATVGQEASVVTDYVLKILGLDICADTMVGDNMIRGISGGQRKRVTTGEMLVGPSRALFMDEISTGVADFLQEVTSKKDQKQLFQLGAMAMIYMTVFLRTELNHDTIIDGGLYMGALFFGVMMIVLNGMAELSMIPITLLEVGVWVAISYYVIGFDPNVGRFIKHFVVLVLMGQVAAALFQTTGAVGRNMVLANTYGGFVFLVILVLGGFMLSRGDIGDWWIWAYYLSPVMYAMNAITVNEFLGHQWSHLTVNGTETLGVTVLRSKGMFPHTRWYWIGIGALVISIILLNITYTLALDILNPLGKMRAIVPEAGNTEQTGEGTELSEPANQNKKKGMILPFEPHSLTFNDIKYSVDMPKEMKEQGIGEDKLLLLKGVTGAFRPGVLTALMGVSGAAWLRLPAEVDSEKRKMFVDEVLELVELNLLQGALVGLPGVDGLDARAAAIVMRTVRNTVDTGRTVVCTIHQPSIDIFEAFDELFLMKRGGEEIYVGPLGHRSCELISYFESIEGVSKIKDGYNPATWMLEVTTPAQEMALGIDFTEMYRNSDLYRRNKELIKELTAIALIFGSIFWDLGTRTEKRQDLSNAMGSILAICGWTGSGGNTLYNGTGWRFIIPRPSIPVWWRWYSWDYRVLPLVVSLLD
ncbi:hypothetical protein POM88_051500 [Heracleum sosnowskyi]|uniref:ABC transporter domain-containing protein n=1 Tax=Heracleum sosnowskyi TaxID=360622 RepID=A0AAD8H200_9APIA|nr:hypothetical protein POM88_051500 [Heracleum sosnowskyi]